MRSTKYPPPVWRAAPVEDELDDDDEGTAEPPVPSVSVSVSRLLTAPPSSDGLTPADRRRVIRSADRQANADAMHQAWLLCRQNPHVTTDHERLLAAQYEQLRSLEGAKPHEH